MIKSRSVSILHFEDDKTTQLLIKKRLKLEYNAKIRTESTLLNLGVYCNTKLIESFDLIICDFMFPTVSAEERLEILSGCDKYIIFYTCLDRVEFQERVYNKLGYIPTNFIHCRKAHRSGMDQLINQIDSILA